LADRILTASPWAQPVDAALVDQAYRSEIYLTVRWASALPVRQANAVALGVESRAAQLLLKKEPSEYVLDIAGFPAGAVRMNGGAGALEKELLASATLTSKKRGLKAISAVAPDFGSHLMAEVHFPRSPAIELEEEQIEMAASLFRGRVRLRARFSLKAMVYEGALAL
jgi:hypothetical protein